VHTLINLCNLYLEIRTIYVIFALSIRK
jgi:hypothetical protein